jgi:prepilin signal peptidase PulO-like enzyme (type II secretory pathway)
MTTLIFIFVFLLGMIIGSFLNVVIYRFNSGKTLKGRSICMTCNKTLKWYELIPVLSFLIQSGRCRGCSAKISYQYMLVELSTGIIFLLIALHFLPLLIISQALFVFLVSFFMLIFSVLIVIAVYDIRHKIIPDKLVYFFILLSLISVFINTTGFGPVFVWGSWGNLLAGPLLAIPFGILWLVSRGKWMGFGDAKLVLGIGWMLGLLFGITAIIFAFWIGTIIGLLLILISRRKLTGKTEIPFAPFLILGTLLVFFFEIDFLSLSSFIRF